MPEAKSGVWRRIFRPSPFKMTLLIVFILLFLYVEKEIGVTSHEGGGKGRFISLELLEAKAYDIRFQICKQFFPSHFRPSPEVVIVAIDERALDYYGWPFPRSLWGEFLRRMREYEAKVVAFDVVFETPSRYLGLELIKETAQKYRDLGLAGLSGDTAGPPPRLPSELLLRLAEYYQYLQEKEREADVDREFAEELKKTPGVVLGWYGYRSWQEVKELADQDFSDNLKTLLPSRLWPQGELTPEVLQRLWRIQFVGFQTNIPVLSENCERFGFFTAVPDSLDGTIRRTPMIGIYQADSAVEEPQSAAGETANPSEDDNIYVFPSLALAAISAYLDLSPLVTLYEGGVAGIAVGDYPVPTDESGRLLINWMGPQYETFRHYSIFDVLTGFSMAQGQDKADPKTAFKNKIVLVGSTAIGAHDMRITPFGVSPGVEMHANVISNILNQDTLVKPEWFRMFDMFFILLLGLLFGLVLPRLSAVRGGIVTLFFFMGYLGVNIYLFVAQHYAITLLFPLAELVLIFISVTIYRYATEEREKRFIKRAFQFYLSPSVIDQLMKDPSKLKLGGERKVLTAFFSDIQGFSSISEKMDPQELVAFLNEYLTDMCDILLRYDATIDKFEGDAIIAFFGAPIDYPDHARRACLCAVEIQERMVVLRRKWTAEGRPEIFMRIGLNTGEMVVGNMGSAHRMDYTMMGDSVNLAARLEGAGKQYKIYTMVSEYTLAAAGDGFEIRELDKIRVVGKAQPVKVYELLGLKGKVPETKLKAVEFFNRGLELYQNRYWLEASAEFRKALEADPTDGPSKVYIARCQEFSENPPPAGWDGVYEMKTK